MPLDRQACESLVGPAAACCNRQLLLAISFRGPNREQGSVSSDIESSRHGRIALPNRVKRLLPRRIEIVKIARRQPLAARRCS